jgi:XTP/dITP diphosphohydrolase
MRLVVATTNRGKLLELQQILGGRGVEVGGLIESAPEEEIETGSTFEENALLKARYYHSMTGMPTVADDSGLEVFALGGAPGVYSSRYAGPAATDADRVAKLLDEMRGVPADRRGARFVCAAAMVWPGGERVFMGEAQGVILDSPRGEGGFGYDPVFYYAPLGKTFAELTAGEKARVSHRGLALARLSRWLEESGLLDTAGSSDKIINPTV